MSKLQKIVYKTAAEVAKMKRFDMSKKPIKQRWFLRPIAWAGSLPEVLSTKAKIEKIGIKGLKPPYLLLMNHASFIDFKIMTTACFPHTYAPVSAIDGFIGREWLMRNVGCICKRKFTPNDITLIRQIIHSLHKQKSIVALFPEARWSLNGTTALLPESLGKMVKLAEVPLVIMLFNGNYLHQPLWNYYGQIKGPHQRKKIPLKTVMKLVLTKEQVQQLSIQEINDVIKKEFVWDDWKYQKENNIKINDPKRAFGLHYILYQCPNCLSEQHMKSNGTHIWCENCGKRYELTQSGEMQAENGITEFPYVPDWFEWERANVRQQILNGTYCFNETVSVETIPNSKGLFRLGTGKLTHDKNGFLLRGDFNDENENPFMFKREPLENYSAHVEFSYFGKGSFISVSDTNNTYVFYPTNPQARVCKVHFGVEELFKIEKEKLKDLEVKKQKIKPISKKKKIG